MKLRLEVLSSAPSFVFETSAASVRIGRDPESELVLAGEVHPGVSWNHVLVELTSGGAFVADQGSSNGTYLGEQRVEGRALVRTGEVIGLGKRGPRLKVIELDLPRPSPSQEQATLAPLETPDTMHSLFLCVACRGANAAGEDVPLCPACRARLAKMAQPIPGFQILREIGRGGMGIVYLALTRPEKRLVALKVLHAIFEEEPVAAKRFLREARILQELDHPHIVPFLSMGQTQGQIYLAMEYIAGTDAFQSVRGMGPLEPGRAIRWVGQLLQALEYAHAKGFIHRDIKPANLLISTRGGADWAYLTDFGLARTYVNASLSRLTRPGELSGTLHFMSPEQVVDFGEALPSADQYSAAATLYFLLTGKPPHDFPESISGQVRMALENEPVPLRARRPDLPPALADAVHRALHRDPAARFPAALAFRQAILPFGGAKL